MAETRRNRNDSGNASQKPKKKKVKYKIHWLRILLAVIIVGGIIGCGVVAGAVFSIAKDTPDLDSIDLDSYAVTTAVLDKDGVQVGNLHAGENRVPVEYHEISPNAINALIAIEDQRFREHSGIDPIRIGGAMVANIKAGKVVQGGSTITQQLTGLVYLDRNEKSLTRKIKEAVLALQIEKELSKDEIITHYLNRAYFNGGAYGIEAASQYYFAKHASELDVPEAAMLAGLIQNPSKWSPIGFPENALYRRNLVIDQMANCGFISETDAKTYKATPITLSEVRVTAKQSTSKRMYQSFLDHVVEEALDILNLRDNEKALYTGGYIIHTTMDQKVQQSIETVFNDDSNFPNAEVQAAMIITEPDTGAIRGVVGARHQSAAREMNRATQMFRQPGSSFKPLAVYAPAFEAGYGPGTVIDDYPKDYDGHVFQNSNRTYNGLTTVRKGIISSLNVVAVKTMELTGINNCYDFLKDLGFSKLSDEDRNLSTALGGVHVGVSPMEMAGAYGAIANSGIYNEPYAITKITDRDGKVLWEHKTNQKVVMSAETSYLLTNCLTDAATNGTGYRAKVNGHQTSGKTGTTSDNKDAWFAGYTKHYVGIVWIGYDQPKQLGSNAFGGTLCAPIFSKVMNPIHSGLPAEEYKMPSGITSATIDTKSGMLASSLTPAEYVKTELFNEKHVPKQESDVWQYVQVCAASGQQMCANCPGPAVTRLALVRHEPWVPIISEEQPELAALEPADAVLEANKLCEVHGGENAVAAQNITISGNGNYNSHTGVLQSVDLSWSAAQGDAVYIVHRSTVPDFSEGEALDMVTTTHYTDRHPETGVTSYYKIDALDNNTSEELGSSSVISFAPQTAVTQEPPAEQQTPSAPVVQEPVQQPVEQPASGTVTLHGTANNGSVTLQWNAPGSSSYQYYLFRDGAQIGLGNDITSTSFVDDNAASGASHTYFVICVDKTTQEEVCRSEAINVTV